MVSPGWVMRVAVQDDQISTELLPDGPIGKTDVPVRLLYQRQRCLFIYRARNANIGIATGLMGVTIFPGN